MSGLDEQDMEIPRCPECNEIPEYWTVYVEGPDLWIYSIDYMKGRTDYEATGFVGASDGLTIRYKNKIPPEKLRKAVCMHKCGKDIFLDNNLEFRAALCKILEKDFPRKFKEYESVEWNR